MAVELCADGSSYHLSGGARLAGSRHWLWLGLTRIFLAKHYVAEVTGLDIDESVAPFLALQSEINQCEIGFKARSFESLSRDELSCYQTIMDTDIFFWDEMTVPLFDLLELALEEGVERIIIADPGRPPFWDLVDRSMKSFQRRPLPTIFISLGKPKMYMLNVDQT